MKDEQILLNVAAVVAPSTCNGPGKRVAIWVQGCTIGCQGCFNKGMQPHAPKHLVEPQKFARLIADVANEQGCEGVTISGGEPFQQSAALIKFCQEMRVSGLSMVVFSGYRKEALLTSGSADVTGMLMNMDILISGPYNNNNKQIRTWLHDDDKEITFLTDRYRQDSEYDEVCSEIMYDEKEIITSGFIDLANL